MRRRPVWRGGRLRQLPIRSSPYFDNGAYAQLDGAAEGLGHLYALVVASHGELVFEEYYRGQDASMGNNIKSVSKSILSALYGIALTQGHFGYTSGNKLVHYRSVYLDEQLGFVPGNPQSGSGRLSGVSPQGNRRVTLYDMITMSMHSKGRSMASRSYLPIGFLIQHSHRTRTSRPMRSFPGAARAEPRIPMAVGGGRFDSIPTKTVCSMATSRSDLVGSSSSSSHSTSW